MKPKPYPDSEDEIIAIGRRRAALAKWWHEILRDTGYTTGRQDRRLIVGDLRVLYGWGVSMKCGQPLTAGEIKLAFGRRGDFHLLSQ
jgi:hypothetical protein